MADLRPFVVTLAGQEDAVRQGLAETLARLAPLRLETETLVTVELILAEALNNVIEHALPAGGAECPVKIFGQLEADGLLLTLIDGGAPLPDGCAPDPDAPDLRRSVSELPEGGFGWYMIRQLATDVRYSRKNGFNHLSLRVPVHS